MAHANEPLANGPQLGITEALPRMLVTTWEARASDIEPFSPAAAAAFRECSVQLETALKHGQQQLLTLTEAASQSGFSQGHLARMVREGRIHDLRPQGSKGRIRIRAGDLPIKPGTTHTADADVHDLASRLYGGKESHHGS